MYFKKGEILFERGNDHDLVSVKNNKEKFFYIRVIPSSLQTDLRRAEARELINTLGTMHLSSGSYNELNSWGAISIYFDQEEKSPISATQLFLNRELWGFDCYYIDRNPPNTNMRGIPTGVHEKMFLTAVNKYFEFSRQNLGVGFPIDIELGMIGGKGNYLFMGQEYFEPYWGPLHEHKVISRKTIRTDDVKERETLCLEFFEKIFDSAGYERPKNYNKFPTK